MRNSIIHFLIKQRFPILCLFALTTIFFFFSSLQIEIKAGFEKQLPKNHPYIQTFLEYQEEFGSANRLLIAVSAKTGTIFDAEFLRTLKKVTEESYYIDGVNRAQISSLFTPNVRFVEIVDGGFTGGNVIPADFDFSEASISQVRSNVLKSSIIGRLVANDFTSAMVSLQLTENSPVTGQEIDYLKIAEQLETEIRNKYENENISIQIIGFAKAVGDIADGAKGVLILLSLTVLVVAFLVHYFLTSWRLTLLAVLCSLSAVVWNIGIMALLGYGFDPMSILMPFLIFAIGISHSVELLHRINMGFEHRFTVMNSVRMAYRALLLPGLVALASDTLGFFTIYLIEVRIIQELAIMASVGVLALIVTNLIVLPLAVTYLKLGEVHQKRVRRILDTEHRFWGLLGQCTRPGYVCLSLMGALCLMGVSIYLSRGLTIGDLHAGVPELRQTSRYNQDSQMITEKYSIGVDLFNIIVETVPNGCIQHDIISAIDDFSWVVSNNPHVQSTLSMPQVMKIIAAGWNEGHPKWREFSRNSLNLVQSASYVETSTGLRNSDCSVLPVMVFMKDHKSTSIHSVVETIESYNRDNPRSDITIRLASGNVGIMAAANDAVSRAQYPIIAWIYGAVSLLCLLLFRSLRGMLCVVLPLTVVSFFAYALMTQLQIGLTISSLPIVALGVGIGVDYGIYVFSQIQRHLCKGETIHEAYKATLEINGSAVLVTGITLSLAVLTWTLSDLQFQRDMGILFSAMLFLNMLGALHVVPALAWLFYPKHR